MAHPSRRWPWLAALAGAAVAATLQLAPSAPPAPAAPAAWPSFSAERNLLIVADPAIAQLRTADFNADGRQDILLVAPASKNVGWRNGVDGSRRDITAGAFQNDFASPGDFDLDGCPDVLAYDKSIKRLGLWRGRKTGNACNGNFPSAPDDWLTFAPSGGTGPAFEYIVAGNLTGDNRADYVFAEADNVGIPPGDFFFNENKPNTALRDYLWYNGARDQAAKRMRVADLNADQCADLAGVAGVASDKVVWWPRSKVGQACVSGLYTGRPPVQSFAVLSLIGSADADEARFEDVAVAELDGDSRLDVAAVMTYKAASGMRQSRLYAWSNRGGGTFADRTTLWDTEAGSNATEWLALDTGDVDGDGDVDLVVAEKGIGVRALLNATSPLGTATPTGTTNATAVGTPTPTGTIVATTASSATSTGTIVATAVGTPTSTGTIVATAVDTATATHTIVATAESSATSTSTIAATPTHTATPTDTPVATAASTATPTSTIVATAVGTATPTNTIIATAASTPTPTNTTIATVAATATPTSTPTSTRPTSTPTTTAAGTSAATATPTRTPPGNGCAPMSDVGLVVNAANDAERQLLARALDQHRAAWQGRGNSLAYKIYLEAPAGPTYNAWLRERFAAYRANPDREFAEGLCAANIVVAVSHSDLAIFHDDLAALDEERLKRLTSAVSGTDFLENAWNLVRMPSRQGGTAPHALPWLRGSCTESYRNLAIVRRPASPAPDYGPGYELLGFLVQPDRQKVNHDTMWEPAGDETIRLWWRNHPARLAYPTLRQPYAGGWAGSPGSGPVACDPGELGLPAVWPDPVQAPTAFAQAEVGARAFATAIATRAAAYGGAVDMSSVKYFTADRECLLDDGTLAMDGSVIIVAAAVSVRAPLSAPEIRPYEEGGGFFAGLLRFYQPGRIYLPRLSNGVDLDGNIGAGQGDRTGDGDRIRAGDAIDQTDPSAPRCIYRDQTYAVLWERSGGATRTVLMRPDGTRATEDDVLREVGYDISFEEDGGPFETVTSSLSGLVWLVGEPSATPGAAAARSEPGGDTLAKATATKRPGNSVKQKNAGKQSQQKPKGKGRRFFDLWVIDVKSGQERPVGT